MPERDRLGLTEVKVSSRGERATAFVAVNDRERRTFVEGKRCLTTTAFVERACYFIHLNQFSMLRTTNFESWQVGNIGLTAINCHVHSTASSP